MLVIFLFPTHMWKYKGCWWQKQTSADSAVRILSRFTERCLSVKIWNFQSRGFSSVWISNLNLIDRHTPYSYSGQNPDSAVRRRLDKNLSLTSLTCHQDKICWWQLWGVGDTEKIINITKKSPISCCCQQQLKTVTIMKSPTWHCHQHRCDQDESGLEFTLSVWYDPFVIFFDLEMSSVVTYQLIDF